MKKYLSISLGLFVMAIILLSAIPADAQWRSKTHDKYEVRTGVDIKIDGKLAVQAIITSNLVDRVEV